MSKLCLFTLLIASISGFAQTSFKSEGLYGFEIKGDQIIEPQYEYATNFSEGLACVKQKGKWGYIDADNNWVVKPNYERAAPFKGGVAKVVNDGKMGMIDPTGFLVINNEYDAVKYEYNFVQLEKSGKKGAYINGYDLIPCKYSQVGYNENTKVAYGESEDGKYDIYDKNGLILSGQDHSFSSWRVKDGVGIANKGGKYGLYSIEYNSWLNEPIYVHIEKLYTEPYEEYNGAGELQVFEYIYALFDKAEKIDYSTREKALGDNEITLVKASSVTKIAEGLSGYEQTKSGKGYNKVYDYVLYNGGEPKEFELNYFLDVILDPEEISFREHTIKHNNGQTELWKGDKLYLSAESITPFIYDGASNTDKNKYVEDDYVLVKSSDSYGIYYLKYHYFKQDNLPLNTKFSVTRSELDYSAYQVKFTDGEKEGMLTNLRFYKMNFQMIDFLQGSRHIVAVKDGIPAGKKGLFNYYSLKDPLFIADDFERMQFNGGDYFVLIKNEGKFGIYKGRNPEVKYDEIIDIGDPFFAVTRQGDKYGILDLKYGEHCDALFENQPEVEVLNYYPFAGVNMGDYWIGLDGKKYDDIHNMFYVIEEDGNFGIGREEWEEDSDSEEPVYHFNHQGRFQDIYDSEIYPNFRAKGENGLWGVINHFGDTLLPFEFVDLGYGDVEFDWPYDRWEEVYTGYKKNSVGLYSTTKGTIIPAVYDYYEQDYDFLNYRIQAFRIGIKKKYGLFVLGKGEVIPPIYKQVMHAYDLGWDVDTLIVTDQKKKVGLLGVYGNVVLPCEYSSISIPAYEMCYEVLNYPILEVEQGKKKGVYHPDSQKMIVPPNFDEIEGDSYLYNEQVDMDYRVYGFKVFNKKKVGFYNYFGKEVLPPWFNEVSAIGVDAADSYGDAIVYGEIKGKIYANICSSSDSVKVMEITEDSYYDQLIGGVGIRSTSEGMTSYDFKTGETKNGLTELTIEGYEYDLYIKNGKYGAKGKDGTILIEPRYDSGNFMIGRSEVMIGYENGIKYYIYVENNDRYTEDEW